jgi:CheY-like chemotaxis protein
MGMDGRHTGNFLPVSTIIVASDTISVRREIVSVLDASEHEIYEATSGPEVIELAHELDQVDLVIADIQMSTMGAIAVCLELRLQASYDALDPIPFLVLLDRRPDVFQAKRSGADGWVIKPLDAIRVRRATAALLAGERYEDSSFKPATVLATEAG